MRFVEAFQKFFAPIEASKLDKLDPKLAYTVMFLLNLGIGGAIMLFAAHLLRAEVWAAAIAVVQALGLFALGSVAGFIFALPRMVAQANSDGKSSAIGVNENLVDVSDWITKSILTLSIANYRDLGPALHSAAEYLALQDNQFGRAESMTLIIGYTSLGFLYAYISTRTIITTLLGETTTALRKLGILAEASKAAVDALEGADGDEPVKSDDGVAQAERDAALKFKEENSGATERELRNQMDQLATDFDRARDSKASSSRIKLMEQIAAQMRALALSLEPFYPEYKKSESRGGRLAAVSILEIRPRASEADWLACLLKSESPFLGYHAAVALAELAKATDCSAQSQMIQALTKAIGSSPADSRRFQLLNTALKNYQVRCP